DRAAQGRSGNCRETGDSTPYTKGSAAPLWRKDRGQDGERLRRQQGAADTLQDAGRDQLLGVLGQSAEGRGEREDQKADREQVALAIEVAKATGGDQQHGIDEDVCVDDPEDLIERRVEPGAHRRDRY